MGYMDRDYQKSSSTGGGFLARLDAFPVVKWLLISNLAGFILSIVLTKEFIGRDVIAFDFQRLGVFTIAEGLGGGQIWRLITFQFLHDSGFHLLFNMYALYMFGPFVEKFFKGRAFLLFYLSCGVMGALFYTLILQVGVLPASLAGSQLLGASAGVFGVLVAVAMIGPQQMIRLLFVPVPMRMKTFALVIIGLEVFLLLTNSSNAGGSAGHLGGALMGFLYFKVPALGEGLRRLGGESIGRKAGSAKPSSKPRKKPKYEPKIRPRTNVSQRSGEVDRILDKINEEGLHSLTEKERKTLQEAGKR